MTSGIYSSSLFSNGTPFCHILLNLKQCQFIYNSSNTLETDLNTDSESELDFMNTCFSLGAHLCGTDLLESRGPEAKDQCSCF